MASLIDPNIPITGNPTTLSVRQNFATAKAEIEALQLSDIVTLTGDITGSGSGTVPTTLPIVNNNVGTFQGLQINAKGQVTGATNQSYLTTNQAITISGDATGTGTTAIPITLSSTAVAPGSYTNTSLTVDQKGRITAASNGALGLTGVTAGNGLSGGGTTGNVTISLTTPVSVPNGGLGVSSLTANALLVGTGTSPVHPSLIASDDGVSFKISSNIIVGSATGGASGAMGPGTLNVAGGYYVNGVAIGGTAVAVSDVPPATPAQGNQWWDSVAGQLYVYINDGTSSQWVAATNVPLAPNVILPLTANAVLVGNGSNPVVASAITSDNGATLRVSTNQVIGNAVTSPPSHALVINNAASTPPSVGFSMKLWGIEETTGSYAVLDTFGASAGSGLIGRRSRGTAAAPAAVQASDELLLLDGRGRGATNYTGGAAQLSLLASENWSDTAHGTAIEARTTAAGNGGPFATRFRVNQGVVIGNPAPDPGQGGLILNANAAAPQPSAPNTLLQVTGVDNAGTQALIDAYGTAGTGLVLRLARGTAAVPAPVQNGDFMGSVVFAGRGATTYANSAAIGGIAAETWTDSARGSMMIFSTTLIGAAASAERMRIDYTGNVGIGTTAPGGKLHVGGNATSGGVEGTGSTVIFGAPDDGYASVVIQRAGVANPQVLDFGVNQASLYSEIQSARNGISVGPLLLNRQGGNVGIGTAAPGSKLTVVGGSVQNVGAAAAGAYNLIVDSGPTGADSSTSMVLFRDFTAAASVGAINRTGTNSVLYATTSDARLKDALTESKRGLDALMAIKVSDYKMGKTASQGLLAQDVAKVYPEAVHEGGKDPNLQPWMIDYGRLTPLIIKAVQDLAAEVKALSPPPARKARAE